MKDKLITKLKGGDAAAFEEIMRRYAGYVYAVIRSHSRGMLTPEDIDEAAQDTFVALWQRRAGLDECRPLMPYLAVVARNLTLNRCRSLRLTVDIDGVADIKTDSDIEAALENTSAAEDILKAAYKLKARQRDVFIGFYLYGESLEEIAKKLGITPQNARTTLFRARGEIRRLLKGRGYFNENE